MAMKINYMKLGADLMKLEGDLVAMKVEVTGTTVEPLFMAVLTDAKALPDALKAPIDYVKLGNLLMKLLADCMALEAAVVADKKLMDLFQAVLGDIIDINGDLSA